MAASPGLQHPSHHPVPITRSAARIGRIAAWGLNLMVAFGALALVTGALTVHTQTRSIETPGRRAEIQAHTEALRTELVDLNRSLDDLFQGLLESRGQAGRARDLIGLHPYVDADSTGLIPAGAPDMAALGDSELAETMMSSAVQVEQTLQEARALKSSFREILSGMESQATVWARIPSIGPIAEARLTSDFGLRRDPFTGRLALHKGLDMGAATGTPVHAPAEGRVTRAGRYHGYGLLVEIDHGNGIHTRYGHNSRLLVHAGQWVRRGQVISKVGQTGRASAPHLHYEVLVEGKAVNPEPYILPEYLRAE